MKKILVALMLCVVSIICYAQFNFEQKNKDNFEKICGVYNGAIYLNLNDSSFIYSITGQYYIYGFGIDQTAPYYKFELIFNSKQELEDFLLTVKQIYDNYNDYNDQKIIFQNNRETYKIHAPSSKMFVPYITLSDVVWLNGRQYRDNEAGYVLGYIHSPLFMKKINKALSQY